jgi:hypothetical protein
MPWFLNLLGFISVNPFIFSRPRFAPDVWLKDAGVAGGAKRLSVSFLRPALDAPAGPKCS